MTMSKQSAVGFLLVGVALALQIVCSYAGIDGDVHTALMGVLDAGIGLLGLQGLYASFKAKPPVSPGNEVQ